jgi:hypothetical protein
MNQSTGFFTVGSPKKARNKPGTRKRGFESGKGQRVGLDRERAVDENPAGEICPDGQIKTTG